MKLRSTASGCVCVPNMPSLLFLVHKTTKNRNSGTSMNDVLKSEGNDVLKSEGNINSGSGPEGEVFMDPASESESDEEGAGGAEEGGVAVATPRTKKRGTSVFQAAIKDTN